MPDSITPRLMSGADAAEYCGLCPEQFSQWVKDGRLPKSLPGTRRWDRKAIDMQIDKLSGIPSTTDAGETAFETWKRENDARKANGEWEKKYEARKTRR